MQSITLEKNTLSIKYADKFFTTTFNENTFKDCRIISNENIVDMINDPTYTTYTYDAIMESLTLVINFVEKTRFITITDKCEIILLLETNNEQLFVRDKISSLEQQITQLKLDNERLRNELYSDKNRIIRHRINNQYGYFMGNLLDKNSHSLIEAFSGLELTIDEFNELFHMNNDLINEYLHEKLKCRYEYYDLKKISEHKLRCLRFNGIEQTCRELGLYEEYTIHINKKDCHNPTQYFLGDQFHYLYTHCYIKYRDVLLCIIKYKYVGNQIIIICEIVE